jgi:hypothetical protein
VASIDRLAVMVAGIVNSLSALNLTLVLLEDTVGASGRAARVRIEVRVEVRVKV